MTRKLLLILLLLTGGVPPLAAQEASRPARTELPADIVTTHALRLGDLAFGYRATAGTLPLSDAKGEPKAQVFYTAYERTEASTGRPVTFVFNGGPGAASAYLHLGALGPRVIRFPTDGSMPRPPVAIEDNPDTWLAFTDLVFIDPVGTGYSRAIDGTEDASRTYWGVRQDLDALASFIRLWRTRAGRTNAPFFLAGESYGGMRAAALPALMQNDREMSPAGIVLISPVLEFSLIHEDEYSPMTWATRLPAYAAAVLEAEGVSGEALAERLRAVERFALGDYLVGLASGPAEGPGAERLYDEVARHTGLPRELVARHRARVPLGVFVRELRRDAGRLVSRYDGAITAPDPFPASANARRGDPVLRPSVATFGAAFSAYARDELGWRTERDYRVLSGDPGRLWDWRSGIGGSQGFVGVTDELRQAMAQNPRMQVLVVHGYTDLITPYFGSRYVLGIMPSMAGRPPPVFRTYPGGHMMYSRQASRAALTRDAAALYAAALAPE